MRTNLVNTAESRKWRVESRQSQTRAEVKENGSMKKLIVGLSAVLGLVFVSQVFAETEIINPVEIKTRRLTVYGNNPLKIGDTEMTEANLISIQAGGTLPAVNGAAVTSLASANLTGNVAIARLTNAIPYICLAAGQCTNAQVVAYPAVASSVVSVQLTPKETIDAGDTYKAASVNTTNFTCTSTAVGGTNFYYAVFGIK